MVLGGRPKNMLGQVKTSHFTYAELNANKVSIVLRFGICEIMRLLNRALKTKKEVADPRKRFSCRILLSAMQIRPFS